MDPQKYYGPQAPYLLCLNEEVGLLAAFSFWAITLMTTPCTTK